jgi:hypothetical protein
VEGLAAREGPQAPTPRAFRGRRYEKYDTDLELLPQHKSDDPFMDEYLRAMDEINDLTLVSSAHPAPPRPPPTAPLPLRARVPGGAWYAPPSLHAATAAQKADEISQEKNRALKAAMNADLRKSKIALMEQTVPQLENLVKTGKEVTPEIVRERLAKVCLRRVECAPRRKGRQVPRGRVQAARLSPEASE